MPNSENIKRPIVFVGLGRSGTSAVTEILSTHPDIDNVGEVSPIMFDIHWGVKNAMMNMRYPSPIQGKIPRTDLPSHAVREFFLRNFHSDKKAWVIKPIGLVGRVKDAFEGRPSNEDFTAWCFNVLFECFPEAQIYTIVRDPLSYAKSARRYWASPARGVSNDITFMSLLLDSGRLQSQHVYKFEDFVNNRLGIINTVVANAGLDAHVFKESDLEHHYAAEQGRAFNGTAQDKIPPFTQAEFTEILRSVGPVYEPFMKEARSFAPSAQEGEEEGLQDFGLMYRELSAEFLFLKGKADGLEQLVNQKEEIIQDLLGWSAALTEKVERFGNALTENGIPIPPKPER